MPALKEKFRCFCDGGRDPWAVGLAVMLGLIAGFVCGWNLTLAAVVLLALVINVPTRCFLIAWGGSVLASTWIAPVAARIGYVLLDGTALGSAIAALGSHPLVVLLALDDYQRLGGLVLAIVFAVPLATTAKRWMVRRELRAAAASDDHESSAAPEQPPTARLSIAERWFGHLLFGAAPSTSNVWPSEENVTGKPRRGSWFRPFGVWAAVPYVTAVLTIVFGLGPIVVQNALLERLNQFNQATVEASNIDISLTDGSFQIQRLAMADANNLHQDRLVVQRVEGRLDPGQLLRGRLHIESANVDGLLFDVPRDVPAQAVPGDHFVPHERPSPVASSISIASGERTADQVAIESRLAIWPELQAGFDNAQRSLKAFEHLVAWDTSQSPPRRTFTLLSHPWQKRSTLGDVSPIVRIDKMRIEHIAGPIDLGPRGLLEVTNVASRPAAEDPAPKVLVFAPAVRTELELKLDVVNQQPQHFVSVRAYDVNLPGLIDHATIDERIEIARGQLDLIGRGIFDRRGIDLPLQIEARGIGVTLPADRRLGGLRGELWNAGLRRAQRLRGEARLAGTWHRVALVIEPETLVQQLKHHLRAAAEHKLVAAIESDLRAQSRSNPTADKSLASASPRSERANPQNLVVAEESQAPPSPPSETIVQQPALPPSPSVQTPPNNPVTMAAPAGPTTSQTQPAHPGAIETHVNGDPTTNISAPAAHRPSTGQIAAPPPRDWRTGYDDVNALRTRRVAWSTSATTTQPVAPAPSVEVPTVESVPSMAQGVIPETEHPLAHQPAAPKKRSPLNPLTWPKRIWNSVVRREKPAEMADPFLAPQTTPPADFESLAADRPAAPPVTNPDSASESAPRVGSRMAAPPYRSPDDRETWYERLWR